MDFPVATLVVLYEATCCICHVLFLVVEWVQNWRTVKCQGIFKGSVYSKFLREIAMSVYTYGYGLL